jgi:periplasmic copper chaperone A
MQRRPGLLYVAAMVHIRSAALAALLVSAPTLASAHDGVLHTGCPVGQSFATGDITVTGAFIRATPKGAQAAGAYLTVTNGGSVAETFVGASSKAATHTDLHSMKMNGDVMEMAPIQGGLAVPAGGSVALAPMGNHLMLTGLAQQFVAGQCVEMVLHFEKAGDLPIQLNIAPLGADGQPTDQPMDMPSMDHEMSSMAM